MSQEFESNGFSEGNPPKADSPSPVDADVAGMLIESNYDKVTDNFDDMSLGEDLLRGIYAYGFEKPSAIQQRAIVPCIAVRTAFLSTALSCGRLSCERVSVCVRVILCVRARDPNFHDVSDARVSFLSGTRRNRPSSVGNRKNGDLCDFRFGKSRCQRQGVSIPYPGPYQRTGSANSKGTVISGGGIMVGS